MANVTLGGSPEFGGEVAAGLEALGKDGYTATIRDSGETRFVIFSFGEAEQTLKFKDNEWRQPGVVSKAIIEHLNI